MSDAAHKDDAAIDVDLVAAQFAQLDSETHRKALLEAIRARDVYRKLIDELQQKIDKLELGLIGPKRERFKSDDDSQLSMEILAALLGQRGVEGADASALAEQLVAAAQSSPEPAADSGDGGGPEDPDDKERTDAQPHGRPRKPTGRKTASEHVHKLTMEIVPEEVKQLGLSAFERIGEESTTTLERRVASLVEVTVVRPKFRAKTQDAVHAVQANRADSGTQSEVEPQSWITVASTPTLPVPRALAGPGLLANVVVRRFDDHLPYNHLENIYEREGVRLGRSTMYGWVDNLRQLFAPLVKVMWTDSRQSPYLCVDATGVLVQAPDQCSRGHFWVVVAPARHVLFAFSNTHDRAAVDKLLGGYNGLLVADAHVVYDHLYGDEGATEVACWSHGRKYFFKVLGSEPEIARLFLDNLRVMFLLERKCADMPRKQRERFRQNKIKILVDRHFELCRQHQECALDGTPLQAAIRYSLNQESALRRFLSDGRLPATNNISERQLRRQAVGRKRWLFLGSDDGAEVNVTFASLIASCHLHDIEPERYLREVMCLLPDWRNQRLLELAPCNWKQTREQPQAQQRLAEHFWLSVLREIDTFHARSA
jgi:transposase